MSIQLFRAVGSRARALRAPSVGPSGAPPGAPRTRHAAARRAVAWLLLAAFTATSTGVTVPGLAMAQPRPDDTRTRLWVFGLSQAPDVSRITTTRLEQYLRAALGMDDGLNVLEDRDLIVAVQPEAGAAKAGNPELDKADEALWQGKELLEKKKNAEAATALQRAVDAYREHYAGLVDFDKLVDAYVQLAEASFRSGFDDNGREALAQAMSLRPTLTVDRRLQHKSFVAAFDQLEAEFESHKSGQLSLSSSPPGGKVYIDGVLRGTTPLALSDLRKGTHFVQIRLDGYQTHAQTLRAPMGDQRQQVAALLDVDTSRALASAEGEFVSPEPLVPYAESGNFNDNFRRAARSFTGRAFVDALLYGFVTRAGQGYELHLYLYHAKASEVAELASLQFDAELANAQVRLLDAVQLVVAGTAAFPTHRIVHDPPPPPYRQAAAATRALAATATAPTPDALRPAEPPKSVSVLGDYPTLDAYPVVDDLPPGVTDTGVRASYEEDEGTRWYKSWWFWTLVGAGVAGAAVGTAAGLGAFDGGGGAHEGFGGSIRLP